MLAHIFDPAGWFVDPICGNRGVIKTFVSRKEISKLKADEICSDCFAALVKTQARALSTTAPLITDSLETLRE